MITLKGMTWNHERGIRPLVESSKLFREKYGVDIQWDARSLSDFELFPLEELAKCYDLIMIDHPHIGVAHEKSLLIPLDEQLGKEFLEQQELGAVGKSYESYHWKGHQYAIPLDAAAQVGAYRADLLDERVPETWEDVLHLAVNLQGRKKIAIPFVKVHAYSSFFSVCSQLGQRVFWSDGSFLDEKVGAEALNLLIQIVKNAHPESKNMDPIDMLNLMMEKDEIVYSPLVYGYSNYSREGYGSHVVRFCDMPRTNEFPEGSMIGGVGLAISTGCAHIKEAVEFLKMTGDPLFQKSFLYDEGGQPGHMAAWTDVRVNRNSNGFFLDTLRTLQYGSMRPRFAGYVDFQAEAGKRIRQFVLDERQDGEEFICELNVLIKQCRGNHGLK